MATTKASNGKRMLVNHREVARRFGIPVKTWRRWVDSGTVPLPHQQIGTMLLYDRAVIDHRLETGLWPEGVTFRATTVRG